MIPKLSNISFKSTPICDVKIKKKEGSAYKDVDAVFSCLNPQDKEDIKAISEIREEWENFGYTGAIVDNFNSREFDDLFFAIELKGDEPLSKRIISLCEARYDGNSFKVGFLQSKGKGFYYKSDEIKGGGEVMMYGISKTINKEENDGIHLMPTPRSIGFYRHIGFLDNESKKYFSMYLPSCDFDSFERRVEEKYDFSAKGGLK